MNKLFLCRTNNNNNNNLKINTIARSNKSLIRYINNKKIKNITRTIIRNCCWNFKKLNNNYILYSINGFARKTKLNKYINLKKKFINFVTDILNETSNIIPYKFKYTDNYKKSILDFNFVNNYFCARKLRHSNILGIAMPPGHRPWNNGSHKHIYSDGNIYINFQRFNTNQLKKYSFLHLITLHELGHALGLAHPHDTGGNSTIIKGINNRNKYSSGKYNQNNFIYTVMTYNDYTSKYGPKKNINYGYVKSWMSYDIEALQYLYGKTENKIQNDIYYIDQNKWICINDSKGNNIISAEKLKKGAIINLNKADLKKYSQNAGGKISTTNNKGGIVISNNSNINRATGSNFNDIIYSNKKKNFIDSKSGNDIIYAQNGRVICGKGKDKVIINNINNTKQLIVNGQSGINTLIIKSKFNKVYKIYCTKRRRVCIILRKRSKNKIVLLNIQIIKFLNKTIWTKKYINKAFSTKKIQFIKPY